MSEIPHLLVHEHSDNVGVVVVEGLSAGTDMLVCVTHDNSTFRLTAGADVPIGHKIALKDLSTATPPSNTARTSARSSPTSPKARMSTPTIAKPNAGDPHGS